MARTSPHVTDHGAPLGRRSDAEVLKLFEDRMDSALLPPPGPALAYAVWVPCMRLVRLLLRVTAPRSRESG